MNCLRIALSCLLLSLAVAACDDTVVDETPDAAVANGLGTSPSEPVAAQTSELRMECTETYVCGPVNAPRECCRCWEWMDCPSGPWDPSCYSGICAR